MNQKFIFSQTKKNPTIVAPPISDVKKNKGIFSLPSMLTNTNQFLPSRQLLTSSPDNFLSPSAKADTVETPKQYMVNQYLPFYGTNSLLSYSKKMFISPNTLFNTNSNPMLLEKVSNFSQTSSNFTDTTSLPQQEFKVYSQIPELNRSNRINSDITVSRSNSANINYISSSPENQTNFFQSSTNQVSPLKIKNTSQQSTQSLHGGLYYPRTMIINGEIYVNQNDLSKLAFQVPLFPIAAPSQGIKQQQKNESNSPQAAKVKSLSSLKKETETLQVNGSTNSMSGKVKKVQKQWGYKNSKHACKFCKKPFPSESTQITHENIHLNLKPFDCSICGKKFNAKQNWKRHELVVHKQK